jgi:ABC-type phosphate/phosphonate transport system substrate-binding protein
VGLTFLLPPSLGKAKTAARAEILTQSLSAELGEAATVIVPVDYLELEARALDGSAQIFWGPAAVCARVEASARAIFKVVRNGHAAYRSVLIVRKRARKEDDLTVGRLAGLRVAWVDRLSIGGYLLAADLLARRGLEPDKAFASQTFCGSHPAAATAVLMGTADVAAVTTTGADEASIRTALQMYIGPAASKLAAIAVTDESPTDGVVLSAKLSAADAQRITAKLFPEGRGHRSPSFLRTAMDAEGFVKARPGEYQPLLRLMRPTTGALSSGRLKIRC